MPRALRERSAPSREAVAGQLGLALGGLAQLLCEGTVLARPRLFHLIDALRHLLKLGANRGERLQDRCVALGASLGRFNVTREFLRTRLPPGDLRAQRDHIIARL